MPEPHSLRSILPTVPVCSRDGDGCHSERTAAQWLGVRPGYPQVRVGSVLRGILCADVGNIGGIPPLLMQLARCRLHHPNVTNNHTVTLVQQFLLTINLQLTVEPQYCTYRLQAHHKTELEAFQCQFLKYTERFCVTCCFRNLDAVWTPVPDLVHSRSVCEWLPCRNLWQKGEVCRAENRFFLSWLNSDPILFKRFYIFIIIITIAIFCLTTE